MRGLGSLAESTNPRAGAIYIWALLLNAIYWTSIFWVIVLSAVVYDAMIIGHVRPSSAMEVDSAMFPLYIVVPYTSQIDR